ncbi:MAG: NADH-quinone oxidoreductase subunit A [Myxococcales bacterium]
MVQLHTYLPIVVVLGLAGALGLGLLLAASVLGPRRITQAKAQAFECGSVASGDARRRFAVKFYVVALLFIVFDLEAVFFYPWAVQLRALGWFGFVEMAVFAVTLLVGLVYVWKKGALDWE